MRRTIRFYSIKVRGENPREHYDKVINELIADCSGEGVKVRPDFQVTAKELFQENVSSGELTTIRFMGGDPDADALVYDKDSNDVSAQSFGENRWGIVPSHASFYISGKSRIVALESRRGGVTKSMLEILLNRANENAGSSKEATVAQISSGSFKQTVLDMEIIKEFSIRASSPNPGFGEYYEKMNEIAEASHAENYSGVFKSPSGESLAKSTGIVDEGLNLNDDHRAMVERVTARGRLSGDKADRTINSDSYPEIAYVNQSSTMTMDDLAVAFADASRQKVAAIVGR